MEIEPFSPSIDQPAWSSRREMLVDEVGQLRFVQGTDFGGSEFAIFKDHERGNTTDTKFGGDVTVFVDIHFRNLQLAFISRGDIVQNGCNHFARTAPFRPVVHQDRLSGLQNVIVKGSVGDVLDEFVGHGGVLYADGQVESIDGSILTEIIQRLDNGGFLSTANMVK